MTLRDRILDSKTLKEAMVSKNSDMVSILRFLKSEIQRKEAGRSIVVNLIKKNIETTKGYFTDGNGKKVLDVDFREDGWENKVEILEKFLPEQLSEDEINSIIDVMISDGLTNIGQLMGAFTKKYAGKADGGLVSTLVREKLNKN